MSRRVVVVANDHVGSSMAGPAIRYWHFAQELATEHEVTLVTPDATNLAADSFRIVEGAAEDADALIRLFEDADAVVAQRLPPKAMLAAARSGIQAIYDLYAPMMVENLALDADRPQTRHRRTVFRTNMLVEQLTLCLGNAFLCASERQRDFWLGELAALGRLDPDRYARDPSLRTLVDVVPFGVDPEPPKAGPAVKGVVPGIGPTDTLLLWPGGIWNWFDPLTVIRAVGRLAERWPQLRLFFLGVRHPNPAIETMEMADRAVELSRELGLLDRVVFFNAEWVPYAERGRYLLDADVAVSAHFDTLETRLSFRTRLLDCFWAGLPLVGTAGDELGDRAAAHGAALTVEAGDEIAFAAALDEMLPTAPETMRAAARALGEELAWPRAVRPLRELVERRGAPVRTPGTRVLLGRHAAARAQWSLEVRGPLGAAGHATQRLLPRRAPTVP